MLVDHLTLGHRRPVTVQNPEDRRHLRPGFDLASHEDVSVSDIRPARLAVDDRSVCSRCQCIRRYRSHLSVSHIIIIIIIQNGNQKFNFGKCFFLPHVPFLPFFFPIFPPPPRSGPSNPAKEFGER